MDPIKLQSPDIPKLMQLIIELQENYKEIKFSDLNPLKLASMNMKIFRTPNKKKHVLTHSNRENDRKGVLFS